MRIRIELYVGWIDKTVDTVLDDDHFFGKISFPHDLLQYDGWYPCCVKNDNNGWFMNVNIFAQCLDLCLKMCINGVIHRPKPM